MARNVTTRGAVPPMASRTVTCKATAFDQTASVLPSRTGAVSTRVEIHSIGAASPATNQ